MKRAFLLIALLTCAGLTTGYGFEDDGKAYIMYTEANRMYRDKDMVNAKQKYLELVKTYRGSKYVPYALYMLSFIETDYLKIIDYLNYIKEGYHDFKYWHNAVEKLGDIYFVMGNYKAASEAYKLARTDKAYHMLGVIFSADGYHEEAIAYMNLLLGQTRDNQLKYKAFLVQIKSLIALKKYNQALATTLEALKYRDDAFDNGAALLFYAGKSYFYKKDLEKALYLFSLVRTTFPLSSYATLSKNYLTYLEKSSIIVAEPVDWAEQIFARPAEVAFKGEQSDLKYDMEYQAEKTVDKAEKIAGKIVASEVEEYVVRIAELKDLSVANLIATELARPQYQFPIGIYFRDGIYYAEIRGVKDVASAKDYARRLIDIGYTDTKVIEVVKVTEYGKK